MHRAPWPAAPYTFVTYESGIFSQGTESKSDRQNSHLSIELGHKVLQDSLKKPEESSWTDDP